MGASGLAKRNKSGHRRRSNAEFIVVQHHYHDHAGEQASSSDERLILDSAQQNPAVASFPVKLYMMLERVEADGFAHIVSWQPHGRCFCVHDTRGFQEILPRYFSLSKVSSFQRQLNLYDFTRLTRGRDKGGYYNEFFLRHRPHLLARIQRIKVKGTGVRARSNPEQEPDFWHMDWVDVEEGSGNGNSANPTDDSTYIGNTLSTPARFPQLSSQASIVSHDEDGDDCDLGQEFSYSTATEASTSGSSQAEDILLCGWGMPFYYLGSLPEADERPEQQQQRRQLPNADFLNKNDMDGLLQSALDIGGNEKDEEAFGNLLELIVS